jgi:hypothetical protein
MSEITLNLIYENNVSLNICVSDVLLVLFHKYYYSLYRIYIKLSLFPKSLIKCNLNLK